MREFITGITGFVGSHLADYILRVNPDSEIVGLKRWRSPLDNIKHLEGSIKLVDGDLLDLSSMISIMKEIKPDRVYHLAAQSYVPASYQYPAQTMSINILGTLNLFEAIRIVDISPLIYVASSSEVYGQIAREDVPIKESYPLRPVSPYGVSKASSDMLAYMYYRAYGLKTVRTRLFTHTGPRRGRPFAMSWFAYQIARIEAGLQEPVIKFGNLESIRTFMDIRDAVRAILLLMDNFKPGEVYNIGGNEAMSIGEALKKMLKMSSVAKISIKESKELLRPIDVTLQIPDTTKFRNLTGWEPEIPISKTFNDLLSYWRERI